MSDNHDDMLFGQLLDYQQRVVRFMRKNRELIVSHDTGMGKTLTAIAVSEDFLNNNPNGVILVVTPKSLQDNFKKEMRKFNIKEKDNYNFYTIDKFFREYKDKLCPKNSLLIIDEAHELRTAITPSKGKKAMTSIICSRRVTKVLLLTATMIYNSAYDLINLVSIAKGQSHVKPEMFKKIITDPKLFNDYFSCIISNQTKPTDNTNYPEKREYVVKLKMTDEYYDMYRQVEKRHHPEFVGKDPFAFLSILRQSTNKIEKCEKCDWVLAKILEGDKCIVYSTFKAKGIRILESMLDKLKVKFAVVDGEMSKAQRTLSVNKYNNNEVKVLFITKAGGLGLDLKGTRNLIIMESSWNKANVDQVVGRAVRYMSHTSLPPDERYVNVYHLVLVKPVLQGMKSADEVLLTMMANKENDKRRFMARLKPLFIENDKSCWK